MEEKFTSRCASSAETRSRFQFIPPRRLGVQYQSLDFDWPSWGPRARNGGVGFFWRDWSGTDGVASNSWVTWSRSAASGAGLQSPILADAARTHRVRNERIGCACPLRVVHQSGHVPNALLALGSFPPPARGRDNNREISSRRSSLPKRILSPLSLPRSCPRHPFTTTTTTSGFNSLYISYMDRLLC